MLSKIPDVFCDRLNSMALFVVFLQNTILSHIYFRLAIFGLIIFHRLNLNKRCVVKYLVKST